MVAKLVVIYYAFFFYYCSLCVYARARLSVLCALCVCCLFSGVHTHRTASFNTRKLERLIVAACQSVTNAKITHLTQKIVSLYDDMDDDNDDDGKAHYTRLVKNVFCLASFNFFFSSCCFLQHIDHIEPHTHTHTQTRVHTLETKAIDWHWRLLFAKEHNKLIAAIMWNITLHCRPPFCPLLPPLHVIRSHLI